MSKLLNNAMFLSKQTIIYIEAFSMSRLAR